MPVDLGDTVRLMAPCVDPAGEPANAATVTLTITLPDGTTASPTVANPPATTGTYTHDYVPAADGRHLVRWVFTDPADAYTDLIDVRPADPLLLMSLADAKEQLNISSTRHDAELRSFIEAVTEIVERFVGSIARRVRVERHSGGGVIVVDHPPILSVTSVEAVLDGAVDEDVDDLAVAQQLGIISRIDGAAIAGPVDVTYVAGRTSVAAHHRQAGAIILQHLWDTQRGTMGGPRIAGMDTPMPGSTYSIPRRALDLLGQPLPGIA